MVAYFYMIQYKLFGQKCLYFSNLKYSANIGQIAVKLKAAWLFEQSVIEDNKM